MFPSRIPGKKGNGFKNLSIFNPKVETLENMIQVVSETIKFCAYKG